MALIKCSECGNDVSDKAKACPNCGFPLKKGNTSTKKETVKKTNINNKYLIFGGIGLVLIFVIVIAITLGSGDKLVCKFETNNNTGYINNKVTYTFKNGKVKTVEALLITRPTDDEVAEYLWSVTNKDQDQYNYYDGMTYKATFSENNEITLKYSIDAEKAPTMFNVADAFAGIDGITPTSTKEEIKKILENSDYKCN